MTNNGPIPQTAVDYFRSIERRLSREERRSAPVSAADLLGPGFSAKAVAIFDWEAEEATFNGFFYSEVGALHSPDVTAAWTGFVVGHEDGTGVQVVMDPENATSPRQFTRTFKPNPLDADSTIYAEWKRFATPTGNVDATVIDPPILTDIDTALANAAAAMSFASSPTKVYRQDDQPTNPDTDGRDLRAGDHWFDTNDDNHMWVYDATLGWVDAADAALDGMQTAITAAQTDAANAVTDAANAQTAAGNASTAAASKSKVYRQPGKPTGGTYSVGDVWYDTDDGNRIYVYDPAAAGGAGDFTTVNLGSNAIAGDAINGTHIADNSISTAELAANAITAKHTLTGPTIQTEVTASRGIKITSAGLAGYDTTGAPKFSLTTAGVLSMSGAITTGGTIDGAIVTGGTVQTETTPYRGIKINSAGLTAYNSSGLSTGATLTIDAATGSVAMLGTLKSGSTISGATIVGGALKTNPTASRGVEIAGSGIVGYNSTGSARFILDGNTGTFTTYDGYFVGTVDSAIVTGGTVQTEGTPNRGIKMNSAGITAYDSVAGSATLGQPMFTLSATTGKGTFRGDIVASTFTNNYVTIASNSITIGPLSAPFSVGQVKIDSNGHYAGAGRWDPSISMTDSTGVARYLFYNSGFVFDDDLYVWGTLTLNYPIDMGGYGPINMGATTMSGPINMGGNNITSVGTIVSDNYIRGALGANLDLRQYDGGSNLMGRLLLGGGGNISGKWRTASDTGTCIAFDSSVVVAGLATYNATAATSGNTAGFWAWKVNAFNSFNNASDVREKNDIEDVDPEFALDVVKRSRARSYTLHREPERKQYGVIAQEFMDVLPSALGDNGAPEDDEDHRYTMHYQDLHMLHLVATQALIARIEELESRLN